MNNNNNKPKQKSHLQNNNRGAHWAAVPRIAQYSSGKSPPSETCLVSLTELGHPPRSDIVNR